MDEPNDVSVRNKAPFLRRRTLLFIGGAVIVAVVCFVVVALQLASEDPYFESPLHSALTGVGLLGVGLPLCLVGAAFRRRSEGSPYFEEAFIAGVISLFGYVCVLFGLLCIGLGAYALLKPFFMFE
jgi:hypothetical protein